MNNEPWNKHTPGDPMPCKCGESVVEVKLCGGGMITDTAKYLDWCEIEHSPDSEITDWHFVERKGEDVIAVEDGPTLGLPPSRDYERGQWTALNRVLALLNTYDSKEVPKKRLYQDVMGLRPEIEDPYAALSQHLHGDGETEMEHIARDIREGRFPERSERRMAPPSTCATTGCTNPAVIRFNRWLLCRDCYDKMEFSA